MKKERQSKTVLVIEDEADVRSFASRVLELEGYRVLGAENGEEGLRLIESDKNISLVLLDLRLPERDGWSLLSHIKNKPELSAITIVVFTASAGVTQRVRALCMGADKYLVKPLSAASLRKAVAGILHHKEGYGHAIKEIVNTGS